MAATPSPRIAVLGLGGTIAMRSAGSGAVPALTTEDLVETLPAESAARVTHVESFRQVPGAHLELADLVSLAGRIRELAESGLADGVVVIQGTDTIEETVFAMEILPHGDIPVVVTGAMRHAGQPGADGASNVTGAVCVAASPAAADQSAVVCFNDEIHAAWAVQKTAATNPEAFSSPGFGPIGHVIEGRARFLCKTRRWPTIEGVETPAKVAIVTASLGEGPELVDAVRQGGWAGLVVQATGAGHLHHTWVEPLARLAERLPVVLATRVSRGPVLGSTYAFPGSESDLLSRGLISAGFLCASKARILLSMALGTGMDREQLSSLLWTALFQ